MIKKSVLLDKSFLFAVRIVDLYKVLSQSKREYILSKQILRSGTSIGANIEEANGAISSAEFSSKLSIAYKEARETGYWIKLLSATDYIEEPLSQSLWKDCDELQRILCASIKTARKK